MFDLQTPTGVEIVTISDGVERTKIVLPAGSYAGLIYRPEYFLDNAAVRLEIRGRCHIHELIVGALP